MRKPTSSGALNAARRLPALKRSQRSEVRGPGPEVIPPYDGNACVRRNPPTTQAPAQAVLALRGWVGRYIARLACALRGIVPLAEEASPTAAAQPVPREQELLGGGEGARHAGWCREASEHGLSLEGLDPFRLGAQQRLRRRRKCLCHPRIQSQGPPSIQRQRPPSIALVFGLGLAFALAFALAPAPAVL
eukprot:scaffold80909_cov62-Phaeocystis_antarctica.AAC.7